jgi:hypothetical protein
VAKVALILGVGLALAAFSSGVPAQAQGLSVTSESFSTSVSVPPPRFNPPVIAPPQPPVVSTPPPRMPIIPIPPTRVGNPVPVNPMDLTRQLQVGAEIGENANALSGIKTVGEFASEDRAREGIDTLVVKFTDDSKFKKLATYAVEFESGEILASLHKPSRLGFVSFPLGKIALSADSDITIKKVGDVFHVVNCTGRNEGVKIKLMQGEVGDQNDKVIALAPGYELIVGPHVLKRSDIRIADGCARRHFKMLDSGKIAVCEISTESMLNASAVVTQLNQKEVNKDGRILGSLSKMAAVLNYVNGTDGFTTEPPNNLAHK